MRRNVPYCFTVGVDLRDQPIERRLVGAALACIGRRGVAKTTLEDLAREARCSRATVYRAFPGGKDAVLAAAVAAEITRLLAELEAATGRATTLEDALVGGITVTARFVGGHRPLQFLFTHEPGLVLPHLAFGPLDDLLARVRLLGGPLLAPYLPGEAEAGQVVEWVARIVISYTCSPAPRIDLTDDASVRRLVRAFVLPGLSVPLVPAAR